MLAKVKNGVVLQYPYTLDNLRADNPTTEFPAKSLPALFADTEAGIGGAMLVEVVVLDQPLYNDITHQLSYSNSNVTQVNGVWQQSWTVSQRTTEEAAQRLANLRVELEDKIKSIRDDRNINGGFPLVIEGVKKWVHSDTFSRTQWPMIVRRADQVQASNGDMHAIMQKLDGSGPLAWKLKGGTGFLALTAAMALEIAYNGQLQDEQTFTRAEVLIGTIKVHPDPKSVNIFLGWPQIFGEPDPS